MGKEDSDTSWYNLIRTCFASRLVTHGVNIYLYTSTFTVWVTREGELA